MPIRKRISDPYSDDVKRFEKRMREGAPPPTPKKPDAATREPFVKALTGVPVDKQFERHAFFRQIADHWMIEKYGIWGQTLYIQVNYRNLDERFVLCTGASVCRVNPNKRGIRPSVRLQGAQRTWYSQVLHWIGDTEYDG